MVKINNKEFRTYDLDSEKTIFSRNLLFLQKEFLILKFFQAIQILKF